MALQAQLAALGFRIGPATPIAAGSTEFPDCVLWEFDGGEVLD